MSFRLKLRFILLPVLLSISLNTPIAFPGEIKIAWDPNSESDLAGYKVYFGTASQTYGPPINVGNVTTHKLANLTTGQVYFIAVTAYDKSNNESGYSNEVSGRAENPPTDLKLVLKAGPNMVSFPTISGQVSVADLLLPIAGQFKSVYGYEGCNTGDPWRMYDPTLPSYVNDLQYIASTMGFWIDMKQDSELNIPASFPSTLTIPLCAGWNLISYPGDRSRPVADALASLSGKFEKIYCFKNIDLADPWKLYNPSLPAFVNDLTTMEPGFGYWIYMKENHNWVVNNF